MSGTHTVFGGSIREKYDRILGPMWFDPFALELAARLPLSGGMRVLELACGTGIATRRLLERLPSNAALVATDLNPPMLEWARHKLGDDSRVAWQVADATRLPFPDRSFDAVVCQFGVMFFPDKAVSAGEVFRVLELAGAYLFSTWDSMACNDLARIAHEGCCEFLAPGEPPGFWGVPYGMHDPYALASLLEAGGLLDIRIERISKESTCESALTAATGMIEGTPCMLELVARGVSEVGEVTRAVAERIADKFGRGTISSRMAAYLCSARRPAA